MWNLTLETGILISKDILYEKFEALICIIEIKLFRQFSKICN